MRDRVLPESCNWQASENQPASSISRVLSQLTLPTFPGGQFQHYLSRVFPKISEDIKVSNIDDPDRIWPTGLTIRESEELHKHLIDGSRVFALISIIAHALVFALTPWLG